MPVNPKTKRRITPVLIGNPSQTRLDGPSTISIPRGQHALVTRHKPAASPSKILSKKAMSANIKAAMVMAPKSLKDAMQLVDANQKSRAQSLDNNLRVILAMEAMKKKRKHRRLVSLASARAKKIKKKSKKRRQRSKKKIFSKFRVDPDAYRCMRPTKKGGDCQRLVKGPWDYCKLHS